MKAIIIPQGLYKKSGDNNYEDGNPVKIYEPLNPDLDVTIW